MALTMCCPPRICLATIDASRPSMCPRASMTTVCGAQGAAREGGHVQPPLRQRVRGRRAVCRGRGEELLTFGMVPFLSTRGRLGQ